MRRIPSEETYSEAVAASLALLPSLSARLQMVFDPRQDLLRERFEAWATAVLDLILERAPHFLSWPLT